MTESGTAAPNYSALGIWTNERIGWVITTAANRWPDYELIRLGDARYTYSEIHRWTIAVAQDLTRRGVGPGDRVLLHLGNCIELLVTQLAIWRIGAVSVPVVPIYRERELRHILKDANPRVILAMRTYGDRWPIAEFEQAFPDLTAAPSIRIVIGSDQAVPGWDAPCARPSPTEEITEDGLPEPAPADTVSLILYTSGTTSAPKGAMLTGRALLSNVDTWRLALRLSPKDVAFSGAPLAHIAALCSAFLAPMRIGARTAVLAAWKPDLAARMIVEENVTFMAGAAVFLHDLVDQFEGGILPKPSLLYISGGAATSPALIERAQKVGITSLRAWGMTETAGTCTLASTDTPLYRRSQFDGKVIFGSEVKIVDEDGNIMPPGSMGHVLVRSPQMMVGYTDPVLTAQQLDSEGWFRTGDVGAVEADGWFRMSGRSKDIINRGGEKFSSQDIEAALHLHPHISKAAVVGFPHVRLGEEVAACIVLHKDAQWNGPELVIAHLTAQHLAKQKLPARWLLLDQLPMTATGKVQKQVLLQLLLVDAGVTVA